MNRNEELKAQADASLVPGLVIVLDLDDFENYVKTRGLDPYRPNEISGELSRLVEDFAIKHHGVVVYGLDHERGTEEAVIEIPFGSEHLELIIRDLYALKQRIEELGGSISIVVVEDYVLGEIARDRREAYNATPGRRRAIQLLRRVKRKGGGRIIVLA